MTLVTVHAAKTQLSRLIDAALRGEEVIIAKGSKPVVRLVPIVQKTFVFDLLRGKVGDTPDFLEPMDPVDLDLWEGGEGR